MSFKYVRAESLLSEDPVNKPWFQIWVEKDYSADEAGGI